MVISDKRNILLSNTQRLKCDYIQICDEYLIDDPMFDVQYNDYYCSRIKTIRPRLMERAQLKWQEVEIVSLRNLGDKEGKTVCIIGTLFKHMPLQPSILKEISEDNQLMPQPYLNVYTSENDVLWLQDEEEGIELIGDITAGDYLTGIPLALTGKGENDASKFRVIDVCFADLPLQIERPLLNEDKYVVIISGLGFSPSLTKTSAQFQYLDRFCSFVMGKTSEENAINAASIVHVIIAGNCISEFKDDVQEEDPNEAWSNKNKASKASMLSFDLFDEYVRDIALFVDVDVMPGDKDLTNQLWPQQPLHPCTLPKSGNLSSLSCTTNPYCASFDGITFLGTSGQNVKYTQKFSNLKEPIDIMKKTLEWSHLAPSAPDNLPSYPFTDRDPFVIQKCPDVYFVGNQDHFNTLEYEGPDSQKVTLVLVPSFEVDPVCVLINLKTLRCEPMSFK